MNIREILDRLDALENQPIETVTEAHQSVTEGLWDSIKAWAGDEGAKARKALETGAKALLRQFRRFSGPYENSMRQNDERFYEILRAFVVNLYPMAVIKDALVKTQKEVDISGFVRYMNREGTAKPELPERDAEKSGNPFDVEDLMSSFHQSGPVLMEMSVLMEEPSKKQLMTLFLNLILSANEQSARPPVWMKQEMEREGGRNVWDELKTFSQQPRQTGNPTHSTEQVLKKYLDMTGQTPADIENLLRKVNDTRTINTIRDTDDLKRLAGIGYAYLKKGRS